MALSGAWVPNTESPRLQMTCEGFTNDNMELAYLKGQVEFLSKRIDTLEKENETTLKQLEDELLCGKYSLERS
jgi:hypothetical protein